MDHQIGNVVILSPIKYFAPSFLVKFSALIIQLCNDDDPKEWKI